MQIYNYGRFGENIYNTLSQQKDMPPLISVQLENNIESFINKFEAIHVLISDYPIIDIAKKIEDIVLRNGGIFMPVIMDYPYLSIGPASNTDVEGCFHCYTDRLRQHDPNTNLQIEIARHYSHSELDTHDFGAYPSDILLVAQLLNSIEETTLSNFLGKVRRINLYNRTSFYSEVVGVHGCERCGLRLDEKERSFEEIWSLFGKES